MSGPNPIDGSTMEALAGLWRAESAGRRYVVEVGPLSLLLLVWACHGLARSPLVAMYPALRVRYRDLTAELAGPLLDEVSTADLLCPPQ